MSKSLFNKKMLPGCFYVIAQFLLTRLILCGTQYSNAKRHDRFDATPLAPFEDPPYGRHRRDMIRVGDVILVTVWDVALIRCTEKQRQVVRGYTYNFTVAQGRTRDEIDFAFSQAVAYHQAVQHKILNRNFKYFNLAGFPDAYNISFPPQMLFSCYETVINRNMKIVATLTIQLKLIYKHPIPGSLNMTHAYFTQRTAMYQLIELYTEGNHNKDSFFEFLRKCENSPLTKITDLIDDLIKDDPMQALSPTYNRKELYASVKMFISDMIIYELIRQACTAEGHSHPNVTQNDWDSIAAKLRRADSEITKPWRTQFEKDVVNFEITASEKSNLSFVGKFNKRLSDILTVKYFWYVFRVHLYRELPGKTIDVMCEGAERTFCTRRHDAFAIVTWKEVNLDENYVVDSNASTPAPEHNVSTPEGSGAANGSQTFLKPLLDATAQLIIEVTKPLDELTSSNKFREIMYVADIDEKLARWTEGVRSTFKKMLSVASTFAKFTGPIASSVCAALSTFDGNQTANVLAEMNAKFGAMQTHFDRLESQLQLVKNDITDAVKKESALQSSYTAYQREVTGHISRLRAGFRLYQNTNKAPVFQMPNAATYLNPLKTVVDLCKSAHNPYTIVQLMHETFVEKTEFKRNILYWSQTDRLSLQTFLMYRVQELTDLQLYTLECSLYRYTYLLEVGKLWQSNDIIHELSVIEGGQAMASDQLTDIRYAILRLENEQLYGWQPTLRDRLIQKYTSINTIGDAKSIARDLKNEYKWNDFSVAVFKTVWPNWTIPGVEEKIFFHQFFVNPDYSEVRVIPGSASDADKQWGAYIIVNWGMSGDKPTDSGNLRFTNWTNDTCSLKGNESIHYFRGHGIKSLFIWRTYVGVAYTYNSSHAVGQADVQASESPRIYLPHDSCCGFGGSLQIAQDERRCWYNHKFPDVTEECYLYDYLRPRPSSPYCRLDHALIVKIIGNFGEGY